MMPPFPPQFFILLGIDVFLGGSVATVIFDEDFPTGFPYILDFAALVGFIQLMTTPQYLTGFPEQEQFYYCVAYAIIADLAVMGSNLYVALVRKKWIVGGALAVAATIPAGIATPYFMSAFVEGVSVPLPTIPLLPWPVVWGAFFAASALIAMATVAVSLRKRQGMRSPKSSSEKLGA
jgi:hypothetical protein